MRVMVDTNVLISSLLFPGSRPSQALWLLAERHQVVLCTHIVDELRRIFGRKFTDRVAVLDLFLSSFTFELIQTPAILDAGLYPEVRDQADLPILASAMLNDVDAILTGDLDLLSVDVERPEIINVADFLARFAPSPE